jgi:hypothetical protein
VGRRTIKRGAGARRIEVKDFRLAGEIRYIQRRAAEHDGRFVTVNSLVLFSTGTGDAWLLDPEDRRGCINPTMAWREAQGRGDQLVALRAFGGHGRLDMLALHGPAITGKGCFRQAGRPVLLPPSE